MTALLLMYFPEEEDVFWTLCYITEKCDMEGFFFFFYFYFIKQIQKILKKIFGQYQD